MRNITYLLALVAMLGLTACNSSTGTTSTVATEAVETRVAPAFTDLQLINRQTKSATSMSDAKTIAALQKAFVEREQTMEKLMPLFEYAIKFEQGGEVQTWRLNKAGYLMQEGGSKLYKMDTSSLHEYM